MVRSSGAMASDEGGWLPWILIFAAATRAAYFVAYQSTDPFYDHLLHDAKRYHEWAWALAQGKAWEPGPYYQAPLYPYLLSLIYRLAGPRPGVVYILQMLAGLATIRLIARIATRAYGVRAGLVAAALAALYGVFPFHETKLVPGTLAVFLAVLLIDRLQRAGAGNGGRSWIVPGLCLGLSGANNPSAVLMAPLILFWLARDRSHDWKDRFQRGAFLLLGAALIIAPITIRNARIGDDAVPISINGGITFYQGNNPAAGGVFATPDGFSGSIFAQHEESRALAEKEAGRPLLDSEVSTFWLRKGLTFILENPFRWFTLELKKAALALGSYEHPLEYNPQLDRNPLRYLVPLPFAFVLGLACVRAFSRRGIERAEVPIFLALVAQAAVLLLFYVSSRYRLPAMPPLLVLAGAGAMTLVERLRVGGRAALLAPALTAAGIAVASLLPLPLPGPGARSSEESMGLCDRGGAYLKAGRLDEAVATYRAAVQKDPTYPYAHLDLGKALSAKGDRRDAEDAIREALRLAPGLTEAHLDLGVLFYLEERFEEAASSFATALELDPSNADVGNNLVGTYLKLGRGLQAIDTWRRMKARGLPVDPPLEAWMRENAGPFGSR